MLGILILALVATEPFSAAQGPSPAPNPRATVTGGIVSPALNAVAAEFRRRLGAYRGQLVRLNDENSAIRGHWTSQRCGRDPI
jgi:hypothetical protein